MANKLKFGNLPLPDYDIKEAFNSLRTNIRFSGSDIDTIMVTSSMPGEGKSSVSIQLARSFANDGSRTVLIDADMRKTVMIGRYQLEMEGEAVGLSHYLSGQLDMENLIYETDIKNMDMILAGHVTPNPTELLGSDEFEALMEKLSEDYDKVIIDCPPLGHVIDAAIIAPFCDGIVMVIESNAVSYKFAQEIKKQLEMAGGRILGVVLNKVPSGERGYYKKGYYMRYYGEAYGDEGQSK